MARPSDIIVVGAGIVGCAVAHELAIRGASVEIVDERPVGMGATQASAGILAPYIEAREGPLLELTVRSLGLFDGFIERVAADSGVTVTYRRSGTLDVAVNDTEMDALRATAQRLAQRDVPALILDAQATREEEPQLGDGVVGGLLIESHGFVSAGELTRALATAARRRGAQLIERSRVRSITRQDGDIIVETNRGSLTSNAVVLCAGSWSGDISVEGVGVTVPVRPVRGQLLHLGWVGTLLRRVTWSGRCYLVPWADGTLLVGATVEEAGFDERTTVAGVRDLLEAFCEVVPRGWTAGFLGARVGLRPATTDDLPVIGASAIVPNLMYATGHYRNGVLLAPLTAQLVADAMLENRIDPALASVSPSRFGEL
ncbi:MAG: glycine oxidase ThiO [Vicinamibacterales bacterium]